jgi:hypothetical protein
LQFSFRHIIPDVAFFMPEIQLLRFYRYRNISMNSHTQIQNTLNHPPLQPYSPNLNPSTQNSPTQQIEVELEPNVIDRIRNHEKPKLLAKRLANTKQMNYQQWLEVRKQGIGSSDAATACGLNPYMSMLELWMIKTGRMQQNIEDESAGYAPLYWGKQLNLWWLNTTACTPIIKSVESMQCYNTLMKTNTLCWPTWIMPCGQ